MYCGQAADANSIQMPWAKIFARESFFCGTSCAGFSGIKKIRIKSGDQRPNRELVWLAISLPIRVECVERCSSGRYGSRSVIVVEGTWLAGSCAPAGPQIELRLGRAGSPSSRFTETARPFCVEWNETHAAAASKTIENRGTRSESRHFRERLHTQPPCQRRPRTMS